MPNIQLASNLCFLRKSNNLNQTHLSTILNISRQAYSNYENSKRTPDLDSLMRISKFYQISLDQLVHQDLSHTAPGIAETAVPYHMALDIKTGNTIYLAEEETELVTKFRSLSDDNKQILLGFLNAHASL